MRITLGQLKKLIKEEVKRISLKEQGDRFGWGRIDFRRPHRERTTFGYTEAGGEAPRDTTTPHSEVRLYMELRAGDYSQIARTTVRPESERDRMVYYISLLDQAAKVLSGNTWRIEDGVPWDARSGGLGGLAFTLHFAPPATPETGGPGTVFGIYELNAAIQQLLAAYNRLAGPAGMQRADRIRGTG